MTIGLRRLLSTALVLGVGVAVAIAQTERTGRATGTEGGRNAAIADAIGSGQQFRTLTRAIETAELRQMLCEAGPYTLFAPTDQAFERLPAGALEKLMQDPARLRAVLRYHLVRGNVSAAEAGRMHSAATMLGTALSIDATAGIKVNGAMVTEADQHCSNGIIHAIDTVLMPPEDLVDVITNSGHFTTLLRAVSTADLEDLLRGETRYTLLAPTDEAFAKLPKRTLDEWFNDASKLRAVLKHHLLSNEVPASKIKTEKETRSVLGQTLRIDAREGLRINDARVTQTDQRSRNGLINTLDAVLVPADDLIDVARQAGNFKTLVELIEIAGLTDTLRSEGPYTVFAPNDEAFRKVAAERLNALRNNPTELRDVLMHHVVKRKITAAALMAPDRAQIGRDYQLVGDEKTGLKIDDANVIKTDISAANGVIHVIDAVLLRK